jgi:hypothetical protein
MRFIGTVHIERDENANYVVSYAPLGVVHSGRPQRLFKGWKQMVAFLHGPLHVGLPEIRAELNALMRNGAYCLDGVWLSEAEMREHGLGRALCLEAPGGLAYAYARA